MMIGGTSKSNLTKLQRVQNTLAHVTLRQGKFDRITPIIEELQWLPIWEAHNFQTGNSSIQYKIYKKTSLFTWTAVRLSTSPHFPIRSSSKRLLTVDVAETVLVTRGLRHSAVAVWNSLPDSIRESSNVDIFKRRIKTYLFNAAFVAYSSGQYVSTNSIYATYMARKILYFLTYLLISGMSVDKSVSLVVGNLFPTSVELKIYYMLLTVHKLHSLLTVLSRHIGYLVGTSHVLLSSSCSPVIFTKRHQNVSVNSKRLRNVSKDGNWNINWICKVSVGTRAIMVSWMK